MPDPAAPPPSRLPLDADQVLKLAAQSMFDTFARTAMGTMVVDREHRAGGAHGILAATAAGDVTEARRGDAVALTTGGTREDGAWAHAQRGRHRAWGVNTGPRGGPGRFTAGPSP